MYRYSSSHSDSDSCGVQHRRGRRLTSFLDDLQSSYHGRRTRHPESATAEIDAPDVAPSPPAAR